MVSVGARLRRTEAGPATLVAVLLVAAAIAPFAARPWTDLGKAIPDPTAGGAGAGWLAALVGLVLLAVAASALLLRIARRRLDVLRAIGSAVVAYGLLLALLPAILLAGDSASPWAWLGGMVAALLAALWTHARPTSPGSMRLTAAAAGGVAGLLGGAAGLAACALLLVVASAFDVWSWRRPRATSSMGAVAEALDAAQSPLVIAAGRAERWSLGLGDIVFPAALVAAAAASGGTALRPALVAAGAMAGLIFLLLRLKSGRSLPALPFLAAGAFAGLAVAAGAGLR